VTLEVDASGLEEVVVLVMEPEKDGIYGAVPSSVSAIVRAFLYKCRRSARAGNWL